MLLAELVATADAVASTGSRTAKTAALASFLRRLGPGEIAPAVAFLCGVPRQGRIGVGWATVVRVAVPAAAEPSLEIAELDATLGEILRTTGAGSAARRSSALQAMLSGATHREQDFVRRLLTGEMRQGALEGVMTDAAARAAGVPGELFRRAVMLSGDLGRAASVAFSSGAEGLLEIGLEVGRPVQPMLASTSAAVAEAVSGPSSVEWKLDGIRIQVHRRADDVRVYTRNLNDVTDRLPEVAAAVRGLDGDPFVLDGEAIWQGPDGRPAPFQETVSNSGAPGSVPFFFDVLHASGDDLIDRPLGERRQVLEELAGAHRIPSLETADPDEAAAFAQGALDAGHEGVVVKALDSLYQAGRRGKAWRKVKPVRTLDLVVIGVEWGHGRRSGWLSNLHLAARGPEGSFVMVGKTFKGLTDELLRWQTERFLSLETGRDGIVVHVRPEQVVEIALDGVQRSTRYAGGVALRFARVKRYRSDKGPQDADTIDAVRALLP